MGVDAYVLTGLGGPWGGLRARAEVTEERVPFLESVSEPLGQSRVRGAVASSLVIKQVMKSETVKGKVSTCLVLFSLPPLQLSSPLKSAHRNDVSPTLP